ncbi:MAG: asparaginase [Kiloniellales bacterium]
MEPVERPSDRPAAVQPESLESHAGANPLVVEVTRGNMIESRHRAAFAVVDAAGGVALSAGDLEQPVYPRSAIKPLQALPLIETGAAAAYGLGDAEIALACASHGGEPRHVETVMAWLARIGCSPDDLECGVHLPTHEPSMMALLRSGGEAGAVHNNCSGKHSGFLTVARHLGKPTKGYIGYGHPVQQHILGVLESMTGLDLSRAPRGIDGCGIPTIGIPLGNLALAMARLGDPRDQPESRQAACARIRHAVAAEPFMVAGSGRFCTQVMTVTGAAALIKTGAEGVYCGSLPGLGLGIALKVDDGAGRAGNVLMGRLLRHFGVFDEAPGRPGSQVLEEVLEPPVLNRAGLTVGQIRSTTPGPF